MHPIRKAPVAAAVLLAVATAAGCESGSATEPPPDFESAESGCPDVVGSAREAVEEAQDVGAPWSGPTTGPEAATGKTIVYIAQTMTNPGVAGVAGGVQEAGEVIGWRVRTLDGRGTPEGIQSAFDEAIGLDPDGIVLGSFDPASTAEQVERANDAGIPVIGWHAVPEPGPSEDPELFTNVTTRVEDVARISADWIIAHSNGNAGVVLFTDASLPFAKNKSDLIREALETCPGVTLLSEEDIAISEASTHTVGRTSTLMSRFGSSWTHSVAINDLYFDHAAPALRAAGAEGDGAPFNIGAGDGDPSAFERINGREFQAATVPEPLSEQGWQIIDEFNRAFAGEPASGYVAPVHITTSENSGGAAFWDSDGYREAYRQIWGR
ncbi:substrate-binding domain-containing protein [Streptomyces litchfieldiae]|uniref:Substrate-binding domain-containing protein n=1 Tax=Streptomyces litchfieldiae TaxID=3075543 RepID=A0ABU2MK50_9ACTN|nr:substrate-binding domain-containing protein [Streptomyces sp. DSM 44938]MDT0341851.1 substrate-binding domain-containing protein [Streptomyces sp. DSM 44938]